MGFYPCEDCKGRGHFGYLPRWMRWLPVPRGWIIGRCPRCNGDGHARPQLPGPCPICGEPRQHMMDDCERCGWSRPVSPPPPPRRR